jgi:hypothetical protein
MAANLNLTRQARIARIIAWAILVLAAFGVFELLLWIWHISGITTLFIGVASWLTWVWGRFALAPATWLTAFATVLLFAATAMLWRSTRALSRSTNVQQASAGPFLNAVVYPDGMRLNPQWLTFIQQIDFGVYPDVWSREDADNVNLHPLLAGQSYVNVIVINKSPTPNGLAASIVIKATLYFGASGGSAPHHPFNLKRTLEIAVLESGTHVGGRLFNVGGLSGYMVTVDEVQYRDIFNRDRRAASGIGIVNQTPTGTFITPRVFTPKRGEYTDAI